MIPERHTDEHGATFTVPHVGFGDDAPYDLPDATDWERQQIRHYWEAAVRAAEEMHLCAHGHLVDLFTDAEPDHGMLDGGGGSQPSYVATRLIVALTSLRHVHDGYKHRLAVATRDTPT